MPEFAFESAGLNEYAVDVRDEPEALTDVDEDEANAAIAYAPTIPMDLLKSAHD